MSSILVQVSARYLMPGFLLFSFFLLLRGHDLPGGGFAGGLVGAASFILFGLAMGAKELRKILKMDMIWLVGLGLFLAVISGAFSVFLGDPYLQAIWYELPIGQYKIKLSTPLIFDIGVYFAVIGVVMAIFFSLQEEES